MISILVVSHGHEKYLNKLLTSIKKYIFIPYEVILVDNLHGGSRITNIINEGDFENVKVVENINVKSFSKNNNIAASIASYENIFILNPDTYLIDESISKLISHVVKIDPGLYFPKLINPDGTTQSSARAKPSLFHGIKSLLFHKLGMHTAPNEGDYWYFGAAILCRKSFFYEIGGFDENFPMYAEDAELCDRVRKMNYPVVYLNECGVVHYLGNESKSRYLNKAIRSNIYYRIKSAVNSLRYR